MHWDGDGPNNTDGCGSEMSEPDGPSSCDTSEPGHSDMNEPGRSNETDGGETNKRKTVSLRSCQRILCCTRYFVISSTTAANFFSMSRSWNVYNLLRIIFLDYKITNTRHKYTQTTNVMNL